MSTIKKDRFLYIWSGKLENDQISSLIRRGIDRYIVSTGIRPKKRPYVLLVNTIEDKNYEKKGIAYGWISDVGLFNALIGKNEDGSSRTQWIDDPDYDSDEETVDLNQVEDWGTIAMSGPQQIKKEDPPLITVESFLDDQNIERHLSFFGASYPERSGMKNEIYSTNIPKDISENFLKNVFSKFCTDHSTHILKKKKEIKKIIYPLIQIKEKEGKRNCQIEFSPLDKDLATFVLGMTKKLQYGHSKRDIIFFSQSKKRL